jgi:glycosyltransferase involved in cell wall biosynthesis
MSETDRTLWFIITALTVGGAEQTLVDLANNVDADRYDVTIWTIFDTNPLAADLQSDVTVRSLTDKGRVENGYVVGATNPLVYLAAPLRFWYAAAVERPAIIQSFLLFDNVFARVAGLVCPATVVSGVRSVPNDRSLGRSVLDRATIGLSDIVVSNSEAGAAYAVELGADPERVRVVPNGRNVEQFRSADAADVRAELAIDDDELVVGTVGRLIERKGHAELITAWADVRTRVPNARLLVVGDGVQREALQAHAEALGCADSVEFLGRRDDVPELLAAMDVFAFPSHFEGLPGAVIEAMAAGCAIVATPVDGTTDLLDDYRTGLFVPVDSPEPLGWAISRLLESPQLRATLGDSARTEATAEYTVDTMVERFESVYRSALGS